jgi:hypothetical protein
MKMFWYKQVVRKTITKETKSRYERRPRKKAIIEKEKVEYSK